MKFTLLAAALIGAAAAQEACVSVATKVPGCAQTCLLSAASKVGCTEALDFACQCKPSNQAQLSTLALSCVVKACGIETAQMVPAQASSVCACAASNAGSAPSSAAGATTGGSSAAATTGATSGSAASTGSGAATTPAATGSATGGSSAAAGGATTSINTAGGAAAPTGVLAAVGGAAIGILGLAAAL